MKRLRIFRTGFWSTLLLLSTASWILFAQEPSPPDAGADFESHGEVTVGYRFTDIKGYEPQYLQLFDLKQGFRLTDFMLHGDARDRENPFADTYFLSASGWGGDPFETADLKVAKTGLYDLRAQWRQSYYYWDQDDDVVLPITAAAPGLSTGLTLNHAWATVRKMGSVDLTVHATNNLRFNFDVSGTGTNGTLQTTRSLYFFDPPSYWDSFARANPYALSAPLHDETNRITGGVDYSWRDWDFHYKAGAQSFNGTLFFSPLGPGEVSINPAPLSQSEPLTQLSWSQTRRLTSPVSDFSFRGKVQRNVEWRGGYIYNRFRGPATEDFFFSGIAPDSTGALAPYDVSGGGIAQATQPTNIVNQGFTWRIRDWWAANFDYRYYRYTSDATSDVQSIFNGVANSGSVDIMWKNGQSDFDFNMLFTPTDNLVVRPGIRFSKSDIETLEDGVVDPARTLRVKQVRPEFRFGYTPSSKLSLKGDVHSGTSGASYTAISPHTSVSGTLMAIYRPLPNLSIEDTLTLSNARLMDTDYRRSIRANTITVAYAIEDRFAIFGSFGYDSYFAQGEIVYARGTSPLSGFLRDQEIHRVWQGGVDVQPIHHIGFRVSGNYDRLTGAGEITDEPPNYGPLKWPMVTGTVYFDDAKVGRFWIDLQRTYYVEELVSANNFSANLLMLRFTRRF